MHKKDKGKPVFDIFQSNVWRGQPWPYETVPVKVRTISSPSNVGIEPSEGKLPGIGCEG